MSWCDDGIRMTVKGDNERNAILLARVNDGLPDDLLVAKMHAVENADGKTDFASVRLKLSCVANQLHQISDLRVTQPCKRL